MGSVEFNFGAPQLFSPAPRKTYGRTRSFLTFFGCDHLGEMTVEHGQSSDSQDGNRNLYFDSRTLFTGAALAFWVGQFSSGTCRNDSHGGRVSAKARTSSMDISNRIHLLIHSAATQPLGRRWVFIAAVLICLIGLTASGIFLYR